MLYAASSILEKITHDYYYAIFFKFAKISPMRLLAEGVTRVIDENTNGINSRMSGNEKLEKGK